MGIDKAGLTLVKEIIAWTRTSGKSLLATKPIKISTEGLLYAQRLQGDTVELVQNSYLTQIKKAITTYAPANKQKEILQRYNDFISSEADLGVIEKLFKAVQKEFNTLPEEKLIFRYNKIFKNIKTLRDNNPKDYDLMVKGKFFDLIEQGKIPLRNFDTDFSKARISRSLADDLRKIANGEDIIKKVDNLNFEEIKKLVKSGEVYSKNGKLYTHNQGLEHEIQLTQEKFLELFPPILQHISNQGNIGNCWVVGRLDNLISTQSGRSGIYSLFRQLGDDIYVKFPNSTKEILFPKGQVLKTSDNKQMLTVPGIAMLEQALALHLGGKYSSEAVTNINQFSKNPDRLMRLLIGSDKYARFMRYKANNGELLETISGEYIDNIDKGIPYSAYRAENSVGFWESLCNAFGIKNSKTIERNTQIISDIIEKQANAENLKIGVNFVKNTPNEYRDLYNMLPNHQLTLKSIEGNTCWISNPWFNWIEKGVDKDVFLKYANILQIPMQW